MCLDRHPTKKLRFKNGKITCYKIFNIAGGRLRSFYLFTNYKPGYNIAKGKLNEYGEITSGAIHVYTNKKYANYQKRLYYADVVISFTCYERDLVAVGTNKDACFKKVFLYKKDYDKAVKSCFIKY